jgi:uncharacterized membrane protein YbaN (DUF454 family)
VAHSAVWKGLRLAGGLVLTFVGVLGVVLPVMPGWIFLIPGLMLLSSHFPWARRLLERVRPRKAPPDTP